MGLDCIPTIESLLEQNAIRITGNPDFIEMFNDLIAPRNGFELYDAPMRFSTWVEQDFNIMKPCESWVSYPIIDLETDEADRVVKYTEPPAVKNSHSKLPPLYTVNLEENFTITAHIFMAGGHYVNKVIHSKLDVNPKRAIHSLKAIARKLDQSKSFFICNKCNKLVDATFMSKGKLATCDNNDCRNTVEQHFDVSLAKVSSHMFNEEVRIDRFEDKITISFASMIWPNPHDPAFAWIVEKSLPLNTTPRQVKTAAKDLYIEKHKVVKCVVCGETLKEYEPIFKDKACRTCTKFPINIVH